MQDLHKMRTQYFFVILKWVLIIITTIGCKDFNNGETPYTDKMNINVQLKDSTKDPFDHLPLNCVLYVMQTETMSPNDINIVKQHQYSLILTNAFCQNNDSNNNEKICKLYFYMDGEEVDMKAITPQDRNDILPCSELKITLRPGMENVIKKFLNEHGLVFYKIQESHNSLPKEPQKEYFKNKTLSLSVALSDISNLQNNAEKIYISFEPFGFKNYTMLQVNYQKITSLISPQCGIQQKYTLTKANTILINNNIATENHAPVYFFKDSDIKIKIASLEKKKDTSANESHIEICY